MIPVRVKGARPAIIFPTKWANLGTTLGRIRQGEDTISFSFKRSGASLALKTVSTLPSWPSKLLWRMSQFHGWGLIKIHFLGGGGTGPCSHRLRQTFLMKEEDAIEKKASVT